VEVECCPATHEAVFAASHSGDRSHLFRAWSLRLQTGGVQRIKEEPAIAKCVAETVATLSTARAIDKLRSPTSTDRLTPEITADLSVLLKRIAKTPFRQGRASFTRSAWEARLLRHRALALARATENAEDIDVLGTVVVGCETLRSGLLKARLLVPDNSDVR
jgi:hypothetical protein